MSNKEDKKEDDVVTESPVFQLETAILTVNRYLRQGFTEYIRDKKITTQKQFDKIYNEYKELN